MDNYVQFRMTDGEWVCGVWFNQDETSVSVDDVRSIDLVPMEGEGKYGVAFVPYTVTDPDIAVKFYRSHIVSEVEGKKSKMYDVYVEHIKAWREATAEAETETTSNILSIVPIEGPTDESV